MVAPEKKGKCVQWSCCYSGVTSGDNWTELIFKATSVSSTFLLLAFAKRYQPTILLLLFFLFCSISHSFCEYVYWLYMPGRKSKRKSMYDNRKKELKNSTEENKRPERRRSHVPSWIFFSLKGRWHIFPFCGVLNSLSFTLKCAPHYYYFSFLSFFPILPYFLFHSKKKYWKNREIQITIKLMVMLKQPASERSTTTSVTFW